MIDMGRRLSAVVIAVLAIVGISYGVYVVGPSYAMSVTFAWIVLPLLLLVVVFSGTYHGVRRTWGLPRLTARKGSYREADPKRIVRLVRNASTGKEVLVAGEGLCTFREACIASSGFALARMEGEWVIEDERGNDISLYPLSSYDGIATLTTDAAAERYSESRDDSEESSLRDSAEFYD
jgi:hypothetical protein